MWYILLIVFTWYVILLFEDEQYWFAITFFFFNVSKGDIYSIEYNSIYYFELLVFFLWFSSYDSIILLLYNIDIIRNTPHLTAIDQVLLY